MTRINVVPVNELTRQHLVAEYRELPRIYNLVRKRIELGNKPTDIKCPPKYTLGKGHVLFFYNKLKWLTDRYDSLCNEMKQRGYTVNYGDSTKLVNGIPDEWFGTFEIDDEMLAINRQRINDRLNNS